MHRLILSIPLLLSLSSLCDSRQQARTNVGTVLFSPADIERECWDADSLTLLSSRMVFEALIPTRRQPVIKDNGFVTDIVDYYRLILDIIRTTTHGKLKRIMLLAITDVLGGYMHRYVLPRAKDSFYAGDINFSSMERLYKLHEELMNFLQTNGHGWAKSGCFRHGSCNIRTLSFRTKDDRNPCSLLSLVEKTGTSSVEIPLPFTDSTDDPVAVAVPFKSRPFVGLESRAASHILVKYYITSINCLMSRCNNDTEVKHFTRGFLEWIHGYVMPLLCNDHFYAAFGGVYRIIQTASEKGLKAYESSGSKSKSGKEESETDVGKSESKQGSGRRRSNLILLVLLGTIFLWFLLGSLFICYRFLSGRRKDDECPCPSTSATSSSSSSSDTKKKCKRSISEEMSECKDSSFSTTDRNESHLLCYREGSGDTDRSSLYFRNISEFPKGTTKYISFTSSERTTRSRSYPRDQNKIAAVQTSSVESSYVTSSSEDTRPDQKHVLIEYDISSSSSESEEDLTGYKRMTNFDWPSNTRTRASFARKHTNKSHLKI